MKNVVPDEPDWSSIYNDELDIAFAHEAWQLAIDDMIEAGTLSKALGTTIQCLVEFKVQYTRASKMVADLGPITKAKRAKIGTWNPYWTVMRQAAQMITIVEASLGISVVARGRAKRLQNTAKQLSKAEKYLKMAA